MALIFDLIFCILTEMDGCGFDPYIQSKEYYLDNLAIDISSSQDMFVS